MGLQTPVELRLRQRLRLRAPRRKSHADLGLGFVGIEVDDARDPFVRRQIRVEVPVHRDLSRQDAGIFKAAISRVVAGFHAPGFRRAARDETPFDACSLRTGVRVARKHGAIPARLGQVALALSGDRAVGGVGAAVSNMLFAPRPNKTGKTGKQ